MIGNNKIKRLKKPFEGRPFKNGIMTTHTSYMWVEKAMKEAEVQSGSAYFYKGGTCCICGWKGVYTHEILLNGILFYIPICRKCADFLWGTHGNKPYARIHYNPVETNRRKY